MSTKAAVAAWAVLALFSSNVWCADYYVGDTGRSQKKELPSTASGMTDSATTEGTVSDADEASPAVFQLKPEELYFPEVEKAIKASGIDRIAVQSEGVRTTLRTFAEIQVAAITGKARFNKQDSVYTVLGMIYQNKLWVRTPMIPVESAALAKVFGLDPKTHNRVSPVWVMKTPKVRTLVMGNLQGNDAFAAELDPDAQKALKKFAFRVATFLSLPREFKLVPLAEEADIWLAPSQLLDPTSANDPDLERKIAALDLKSEPYAGTLKLDETIRKCYDEQKTDELAPVTASLISALDASPGYLSARVRKLDYLQTTFRPFQKASWIYLVAFFAFLAYLKTARKPKDLTSGDSSDQGSDNWKDGRTEEYAPGRPYMASTQEPVATNMAMSALLPLQEPALAMSAGSISAGDTFSNSPDHAGEGSGLFHTSGGYGDPILEAQGETTAGSRTLWVLSYILMTAAGCILILALINRFILGGRMPVSNMYESITFAMGAFSIVAITFEGIYRRGWIGVGACFFGWALMALANSMPLYSRKVEPLVAVLNSVWLNFHVTSLLISYSCFLMAFISGAMFLIKDMTGNRAGMLPRAQVFEYITYRSVQIGWPLLTLGVFLGAVWANTAWGSFWSWDPKETWALITWLTYTVYLHLRINLGWTGRRAVVASMVGFVMVLLTYFGVSYLPGLSGGLHSYAEPISR